MARKGQGREEPTGHADETKSKNQQREQRAGAAYAAKRHNKDGNRHSKGRDEMRFWQAIREAGIQLWNALRAIIEGN